MTGYSRLIDVRLIHGSLENVLWVKVIACVDHCCSWSLYDNFFVDFSSGTHRDIDKALEKL